jgi:hypothetical protein
MDKKKPIALNLFRVSANEELSKYYYMGRYCCLICVRV